MSRLKQIQHKKTKLKVIHVITGLTYGGAQKMLLDLVNVSPDWVELEFLTLYPGDLADEFRNAGVSVQQLDLRGVKSLLSIPKWVKYFRQTKPDIVHTHLGKADFCGRIAAKIAGVPIIVTTSHNTEIWKENAFLNWIDNQSLRMADGILSISRGVKKYLVHKGVPANKIRVCYVRVELKDTFRDVALPESRIKEYRQEFELPEETLVTLMVGRLSPQKGVDIALNAFSNLPDQIKGRTPYLLIAGEGPEGRTYRQMAEEFGVASRVRFLGIRSDVKDLLKLSDCFLMPSRWEGLGLALLEAFAAGKPAVASSVPGMDELIRSCAGALVVEPEDPEKLSFEWKRLLDNPELRKKLGERARLQALNKWDIRLLRDGYLKYYAEIAGNKENLKDARFPAEFKELLKEFEPI